MKSFEPLRLDLAKEGRGIEHVMKGVEHHDHVDLAERGMDVEVPHVKRDIVETQSARQRACPIKRDWTVIDAVERNVRKPARQFACNLAGAASEIDDGADIGEVLRRVVGKSTNRQVSRIGVAERIVGGRPRRADRETADRRWTTSRSRANERDAAAG